MKLSIVALGILILASLNLALKTTAGDTGPLALTLSVSIIAVALYLIAYSVADARKAVDQARLTAIHIEKTERSEKERSENATRIYRLESELEALRVTAAELKREADENRSLKVALESAEKRATLATHSTSHSDSTQADIVGFLSLLQRKGRLIDFLMDDITPYSDTQVGAAGRIVHQGCSAVIREYFDIVPLRKDAEGVQVTVSKEENPSQYRLIGKVGGHPPFRGVLIHRGWKTNKVELPRVVSGEGGPFLADIIQPAEIELN